MAIRRGDCPLCTSPSSCQDGGHWRPDPPESGSTRARAAGHCRACLRRWDGRWPASTLTYRPDRPSASSGLFRPWFPPRFPPASLSLPTTIDDSGCVNRTHRGGFVNGIPLAIIFDAPSHLELEALARIGTRPPRCRPPSWQDRAQRLRRRARCRRRPLPPRFPLPTAIVRRGAGCSFGSGRGSGATPARVPREGPRRLGSGSQLPRRRRAMGRGSGSRGAGGRRKRL